MYKKPCLFSFLLLSFLFSCERSDILSPKQRGYPRVEFPTGKLVDYKQANIPIHFQYPDYYIVTRDSSLTGESANKDNWFNLQLPSFNGSVHFSYYPVKRESIG